MSEIKPVAWATPTAYVTTDKGFLLRSGWVESELRPIYDESALAQARAEERERCAKVCEQMMLDAYWGYNNTAADDAAESCAGRIRAPDERTEK